MAESLVHRERERERERARARAIVAVSAVFCYYFNLGTYLIKQRHNSFLKPAGNRIGDCKAKYLV